MFIYDIVDPQELQGYVRSLQFPQFEVFDRFLPDVEIDDLEYRFNKGALSDQDVAQFRTFDTEAGIATRPGVARVSGELPPISRKIRLGEEDRLRLRSLLSGGDRTGQVRQIFADAKNMVRAVTGRIAQAKGQALYDGKVVINENGMQATVDFEIPGTHRVAAGTAWSNPAADIISDLAAWRKTYLDTNGVPPAVALTSTAVLGNMLKNTIIRAMGGAAVGQPFLRRTYLDQIILDFGLPPLLIDDTVIKVNGVATRVIPQDRLVFLPSGDEPLGSTMWGITAEALELADEGQIELRQAPGKVAVVEKTFDPVSLWTKGAGISIPVVANADLLLTADVQ